MSTAFESTLPHSRFNITFARQILFTPLRHTQCERPFVSTKPNSDKKAVHLLPFRPAPPPLPFFLPVMISWKPKAVIETGNGEVVKRKAMRKLCLSETAIHPNPRRQKAPRRQTQGRTAKRALASSRRDGRRTPHPPKSNDTGKPRPTPRKPDFANACGGSREGRGFAQLAFTTLTAN